MIHVIPSGPQGQAYASIATAYETEVDDDAYGYFLNDVYLSPFHRWIEARRGPPRSTLEKVDWHLDGSLLEEWRKTQPRWHVYKGQFYRYNVIGHTDIAVVRLTHEEVATYLNHHWDLQRQPAWKRAWRAFRGA
jgi:hypothetical protein